MNRDELRLMSAGKYVMANLEGTIDKKELLTFIDGATFGFDLGVKQAIEKDRENTNLKTLKENT